MNDSLIGNAGRKDDFEKGKGPNSCPDCDQLIPAGETFCPRCGPPKLPEEEPDQGMGMGQTLFRIFLIVLLFGAIAVFKLDINLENVVEKVAPETSREKKPVQKTASLAVDYKTIHHIKVDKANVRAMPTTQSKVIAVLSKGTQVNIIDGNEDWWKIDLKGKQGWISKTVLESEIK